MAKKDQDKHSKRKEEDKDFGLPEIKITPISSEEEKPESKITPVPEKKVEEEKTKAPEKEKKETPPVVIPEASSHEEKVEHKEEKTEPKEEKKESVPVAATNTTLGTAGEKPNIEDKEEEKRNSKAWLIILLIFLLGIIGYSVYYFVGDGDSEDVESYLTEEAEPISPIEPAEEEEVVEEVPAAPVEAAPETPSLTRISEKGDSPRYLVTVGAFIDGDLAKDFSDRLNKKGYNTYIIQPGYGSSFYKLAIADFDNVVDATALINEEQANFEETLWVFKY
ncbi:SPOR domain-containing protein [Echinicola salinicaeni]|uniref:SPOR domain-containing protein n=1 Tax=Echinicola salinicaeni TaxID=2762757 RepID=UPI0016485BDC|nr:SPOR domain-containing protein [Echinicola salinicaeni]